MNYKKKLYKSFTFSTNGTPLKLYCIKTAKQEEYS